MKKLICITAIIQIVFLNICIAQVTEAEEVLKKANTDTVYGWKKGGLISLTFSQVSLTNWAAGGENSIAGNVFLNLYAHNIKEKSAWENNLDIGFGTIKQGKADWLKSDDKIDFTSKYGQRAVKNLYYAGLLNFKSQFAPGYNSVEDSIKRSAFMSPGYLLASVGMDYKPAKTFSIFLAPLTGKFTFVLDQPLADAGAYGVDKATFDETTGDLISAGKRARAEFGGYLKIVYKKDFKKKTTFSTRLELFSNYLNKPGNIDVLWENILSVKIGKYITVMITTTLVYDHDIMIEWEDSDEQMHLGPTTQFKEVFGLGFSYKF